MKSITISLKLLAMVAGNVFIGSGAAAFFFGEYTTNQYGNTFINGPAWTEWPLRISGFVLVALVGGWLAYLLNRELLEYLFRDSQLVRGVPPVKNKIPPPPLK